MREAGLNARPPEEMPDEVGDSSRHRGGGPLPRRQWISLWSASVTAFGARIVAATNRDRRRGKGGSARTFSTQPNGHPDPERGAARSARGRAAFLALPRPPRRGGGGSPRARRRRSAARRRSLRGRVVRARERRRARGGARGRRCHPAWSPMGHGRRRGDRWRARASRFMLEGGLISRPVPRRDRAADPGAGAGAGKRGDRRPRLLSLGPFAAGTGSRRPGLNREVAVTRSRSRRARRRSAECRHFSALRRGTRSRAPSSRASSGEMLRAALRMRTDVGPS